MRIPSDLGDPCYPLQVVSGPQDVEVWRHDPSHKENGYFVKDMNLDLKMRTISVRVMKNTSCLAKSDYIDEELERVATIQFTSGKRYIVRYYTSNTPNMISHNGERLVVMVDCGETVLCPCCGSELG